MRADPSLREETIESPPPTDRPADASSARQREVDASPNGAPTFDDIVAAAPGMARIAGNAMTHLAEWAVSTTVGNGVSAWRSVTAGEPTAKIVGDIIRRTRDETGALLGTRPGSHDDEPEPAQPPRGTEEDLRSRGARLLRRSADVDYEENAHPAYARILDELAPDEARLLRTFYEKGAQPAVDVRAAGTIPTTSELVAPGITMVSSVSGCRYPDRAPRYLNNLQRLGLIWFSREPVDDLAQYQVLEAQPAVVEALASTKRSKTVRRSIHLTPFGTDFCEVCLPVEPPRSDGSPGARA